MQRAIVTGGAGFIGSHIVDELVKMGVQVTIIDDFSTGKVENVNPAAYCWKQDLSTVNVEDLAEFMKGVDVVFHMAALARVQPSIEDPITYHDVNVNGTLNLLEILRLAKFRCSSVLITSDKSYRNFEIKRGYVEDDILGGDDPYSASKASAEFVINSYFKSFLRNKKNLKISMPVLNMPQ